MSSEIFLAHNLPPLLCILILILLCLFTFLPLSPLILRTPEQPLACEAEGEATILLLSPFLLSSSPSSRFLLSLLLALFSPLAKQHEEEQCKAMKRGNAKEHCRFNISDKGLPKVRLTDQLFNRLAWD